MIMKYCKKCVQPDTRPGVLFDEEQVCYACRYEESKENPAFAGQMLKLYRIIAIAHTTINSFKCISLHFYSCNNYTDNHTPPKYYRNAQRIASAIFF